MLVSSTMNSGMIYYGSKFKDTQYLQLKFVEHFILRCEIKHIQPIVYEFKLSSFKLFPYDLRRPIWVLLRKNYISKTLYFLKLYVVYNKSSIFAKFQENLYLVPFRDHLRFIQVHLQ